MPVLFVDVPRMLPSPLNVNAGCTVYCYWRGLSRCCTLSDFLLLCCRTSVLRLMALLFGVLFFNLVLFFLPGRMSSLCRPKTLDVIFSTWSLRCLLSPTELPSHCSATWNAWLASSLEPSWNCLLKHHQLLHLSPSSSRGCRSQREDSCTAAQSARKHPSSGPISVPQGWLRLLNLSFNIYFTYYKQKVHWTFANTLLMSCVRVLPCLLHLSEGALQPTDSVRVFRINNLHHKRCEKLLFSETSASWYHQYHWQNRPIKAAARLWSLEVQSWNHLHTSNAKTNSMCFKLRF